MATFLPFTTRTAVDSLTNIDMTSFDVFSVLTADAG